jgi:ATP-dependent helicase/nuclease subunit A
MKLYAKALQESYQIKQVDTYLILLGGQEVEVVRV